VLRPGLQCLPRGAVEVQSASFEAAAWDECLRDLTRMLHGNAVYMLGPEHMHPLHVKMKTAGDVGQATCEAAFDSLMCAVGNEFTSQGVAPATITRAPATPSHGTLLQEDPESFSNLQGRLAMKDLSRQVAAHISTGPGMQVLLQEQLPPVLWQPTFVICISRSQVRVLTFAFVGEPAIGDRPDRKHTPFMLRMLTDNLIAAPQPRPDESVTSVPTSTVAVKYMVEFVHAPVVLDHMLAMREMLCRHARDNDWESFIPLLHGTKASTMQ